MVVFNKDGVAVARTEITDARLTVLAKSYNPVPCNGCTACCRGDLIALKEHLGDKPEDYKVHKHRNVVTGKVDWVLDHKPNGDCVYLGPRGCTIHDRAPVVCREFDCRAVFLALTKEQRREWVKSGAIKKEVFAAARARLGTLKEVRRADSVFDAEREGRGWFDDG